YRRARWGPHSEPLPRAGARSDDRRHKTERNAAEALAVTGAGADRNVGAPTATRVEPGYRFGRTRYAGRHPSDSGRHLGIRRAGRRDSRGRGARVGSRIALAAAESAGL